MRKAKSARSHGSDLVATRRPNCHRRTLERRDPRVRLARTYLEVNLIGKDKLAMKRAHKERSIWARAPSLERRTRPREPRRGGDVSELLGRAEMCQ